MLTDIEKTLAKLHNLKMTEAERQGIRHNLAAHIDINTLPVKKSFILKGKFAMPALIIALALFISGGTAAAAQGSVPGDALYGVKTNVNERVASALTFSAEQKGRVNLKIAQHRLEEAEELAKDGKLSAEVVAKIQANFERHEQKLKDLIARLEADGKNEQAARLSSNLEASLSAHAKILESLKAAASADGSVDVSQIDDVEKILGEIRLKHEASSKMRLKHEASVEKEGQREERKMNVSEAAKNRKEAANHKIAEAQRFIDKMSERNGAESVVDAKAKLAAAQALVVEGDAKFASNDFAAAFVLYQKAHRTAIEAKLLSHAKSELRLEMKSSHKANDSEVKVETQGQIKANDNSGRNGLELEVSL